MAVGRLDDLSVLTECDERRSCAPSCDSFEASHWSSGLNPIAVYNSTYPPQQQQMDNLSVSTSRSSVSKPTGSSKSAVPINTTDSGIAPLRMLHVPYMDSKLTLLLRDSLGGSTRTVMIANLGPEHENYLQNMYTLVVAAKAAKVMNKPTANCNKVVERRGQEFSSVYRESKTIA